MLGHLAMNSSAVVYYIIVEFYMKKLQSTRSYLDLLTLTSGWFAQT